MNLSTMQENHWREDLRVERTQGRREHQQPPQMQQKRQQEHRRPRQQVPGDHRRPQQQGRGLDWNLAQGFSSDHSSRRGLDGLGWGGLERRLARVFQRQHERNRYAGDAGRIWRA